MSTEQGHLLAADTRPQFVCKFAVDPGEPFGDPLQHHIRRAQILDDLNEERRGERLAGSVRRNYEVA